MTGRFDDGNGEIPGGISGPVQRVLVVGAGIAGLTVANGLATPISRDEPRSLFPLTLDGQKGPSTRKAVETWIGGSINAAWSRDDVKKLQAKVGTTQDGSIGPKTTRALQAKVGTTQDGSWGPKTTTALQRYLNNLFD